MALRGLRAAIVFLTVLPLPAGDLTSKDFETATRWFPAVGIMLGAILAVSHIMLRPVLPASIAAVVLLVLWTVLTGGLHLDGFIDCADALPAAVPPDRRLDILTDVHVGAYGVIATALLILLQWTCLEMLLPTRYGWRVLLLAPVVGRAAIVWAQAGWPYVRDDGLGQLMPVAPYSRTISLLAAAGVALLAGIPTVLAVALTGVTAYLLATWMARRLGGGLTGDTYGALCVLGETAVLLALATIVTLQ